LNAHPIGLFLTPGSGQPRFPMAYHYA
jgi:hypothetical protein